MTQYPQTRDEYKIALLHNIYRLVQALELDDTSEYPIGIAQGIHYDTREFFNAERWKPRPVNASARALIPVEEVVTLRVQHWKPETGDARPGYTFVTGRLVEIGDVPHSRDDGARFQVIPTGKRNPREYTYRVGHGRSLKVWKGRLTEAQAQTRAPLYEHEQTPPAHTEVKAS